MLTQNSQCPGPTAATCTSSRCPVTSTLGGRSCLPSHAVAVGGRTSRAVHDAKCQAGHRGHETHTCPLALVHSAAQASTSWFTRRAGPLSPLLGKSENPAGGALGVPSLPGDCPAPAEKQIGGPRT